MVLKGGRASFGGISFLDLSLICIELSLTLSPANVKSRFKDNKLQGLVAWKKDFMSDNTRISRLALVSIIISFAVLAIKYAAWKLSGSVALYSDALESIVNVIAAVMAFAAIRISLKPADHNHHYGHHKAQYFSAVVEGVLVVLAALMIFRQAWVAIAAGHTLVAPVTGMAVNGIAGGINAIWAWILIRAGQQLRSPALTADGRHLLADVITSLGVLLGLALALATGWYILDPVVAILVGVNVLWQGWRVISSSVAGLMDTAADARDSGLIRQTIRENARGAIEVHDIKTRVSGPVHFIEFHLVVDGNMSVMHSHDICDRIESALKKAIPGAVTTIHVEPGHKKKGDGLNIMP